MELTKRDLLRLQGVHPLLVKMVKRLAEITPIPFRVEEGLRTIATQREYVARGVSKTMNSRHLTGHAVDIVPLVGGKASFSWPVYYRLEPFVKQAAAEVGCPVQWGGDWKDFKDGPHWQLPWKTFPASKGQGLIGAANWDEEVMDGPTYDGRSETYANGAGLSVATGGGFAGMGFAYDPMANILDAIVTQQFEFQSGDIIRVGLGLIIVAFSVWLAYRQLKGRNHEDA